MEQARVMGEQVVELKAEIRIKDAALAAKDALLQSTVQAKDAALAAKDEALAAKDAILQATIQGRDAALQASAVALQAKDALLQSKDAVIEGKNALLQVLQAKDAEIQRLQAELARCGAEAAVGGGARPAPAPARAAAAAAAHAPAPAPARAAIAVAAAAAAAAPPAAAALFSFSSRAEHKAPDVVISPDHLTVTRPAAPPFSYAWARSERGVGAGCGVVRWALQLSKKSGGDWFRMGVASDAFSGYTECWPERSWVFSDYCMYADGQRQGGLFDSPPFAAGDVVTVELERAPGVDGVLRVRVAGKIARELKGLPKEGMLYPIVCLSNKKQSYTMVAPP